MTAVYLVIVEHAAVLSQQACRTHYLDVPKPVYPRLWSSLPTGKRKRTGERAVAFEAALGFTLQRAPALTVCIALPCSLGITVDSNQQHSFLPGTLRDICITKYSTGVEEPFSIAP